ncbi:MAG: hypothetical protein BMS9Abin26_0591 [Gammaproteobacteria bacterium]|nr:MAG: hypothetical protein BMS9Abin26_0591 [Gammaproteobacteria bacterium]
MTYLSQYLKSLGAQRVAMTVFSLLTLISAPIASNGATYEGLLVLPTLVAPSMVPILMFVIMLDIIMSLVFMSQEEATGKKRFRLILSSNIVLLVAMIGVWGSFFITLLQL